MAQGILEGLRQSLRPRGSVAPPMDPLGMDFFTQPPVQEPTRMQSPALADRIMPGDEPALPPSQLDRGAGPQPIEDTRLPGPLDPGEMFVPDAVSGNLNRGTADFGRAPFQPNELEGALSGLRAAQGSQNIPGSSLGPMELQRLASRDPGTVAPGSNQMWQGLLQEEQARSKRFEQPDPGMQMANAAIAGLHPAIQKGADLAAGRAAIPAQMAGSFDLAEAQEAGASAYGVQESKRLIETRQGKMRSLDVLEKGIADIASKASFGTREQVELGKMRKIADALRKEIEFDQQNQDTSFGGYGGQ